MIRSSASKPADAELLRQRVQDALRKAERGEELTKKKLMIVQRGTSPGGCHACFHRKRLSHNTDKGSLSEDGER